MNYKIISKDNSLIFLTNFDMGIDLAKDLVEKNPRIKSENKIELYINEKNVVEEEKIEVNHSFFQGFFEGLIELKINLTNIEISKSETLYTQEAFNFAKETWNNRMGKNK